MRVLLPAIVALCVVGGAVSMQAAEFFTIRPTDVTALSPAWWHNPVVDATVISGDGRTIAGQIWVTGVDFDCATGFCGMGTFMVFERQFVAAAIERRSTFRSHSSCDDRPIE
jgi:hypothetical protein